MTESDWNSCTDPQAMLDWLRQQSKLSERKARLFAAACCRRIWHLLTDERSQAAVETAERLADGAATDLERVKGRRGAQQARSVVPRPVRQSARAAYESCHRNAPEAAVNHMDYAAGASPSPQTELAAQASLVRDIFGNPFRPPSPIPASVLQWNRGLVRQLAAAAYEHRLLPSGHLDPERLGVLADAMEDAGADAEPVEHRRGPGPHYRGCFVVDYVTGRE